MNGGVNMSQAGPFDIRDQSGYNVNNVARDQYLTQVLRERDSFLREIAAAKTRARHLVTVGFVMVAGGAVGFIVPLISKMNDFGNVSPPELGFGGPKIGGVSVGLLGFGIAFIGQFILLAGIVMHIIAAARRRRLPVFPPPPTAYTDWQAPPPPAYTGWQAPPPNWGPPTPPPR
ncbi:hypothetical protein [Pseudonocardia sp. T1-2H]|uniref:hypothetical protein n=1 Tax=Pseudonocardia sp. T1-2H TaxID=3128899 RepID=UPI003100D9AC